MTRSITFTEFGGIDRLQITETARPQPGPGQVRVRVRYAALNPVDLTVLAHG
jgi:NADPH:quinone reductase-like Zn-dependent oxidoreductase